MRYAIVRRGESRSFPNSDGFHARATDVNDADVVLYCGVPPACDSSKAAILVELGHECLAEHLDEPDSDVSMNVLGFARYRNGGDPPSNLVEVVRQPGTPASAVAAARAVFEEAGLQIAISGDQAGRIVNRLVIPKYNAALRLLDEGLASQQDMDLTCKLGLGYPDGPIERVVRGGLAAHYAATKSLFDAYGMPCYAPPRRAVAAFNRAHRGTHDDR